jgi:hypothetical protein
MKSLLGDKYYNEHVFFRYMNLEDVYYSPIYNSFSIDFNIAYEIVFPAKESYSFSFIDKIRLYEGDINDPDLTLEKVKGFDACSSIDLKVYPISQALKEIPNLKSTAYYENKLIEHCDKDFIDVGSTFEGCNKPEFDYYHNLIIQCSWDLTNRRAKVGAINLLNEEIARCEIIDLPIIP